MSEPDTTSSLDIEQSLPTPEEASAQLGFGTQSKTCTTSADMDADPEEPSSRNVEPLDDPEIDPTPILDSKLVYQQYANESVPMAVPPLSVSSTNTNRTINEAHGGGPNKASFFINQPLPPPETLDDSRVRDKHRNDCILALCFFGSMLCLASLILAIAFVIDGKRDTFAKLLEADMNPYYGKVGSGRVTLEFERPGPIANHSFRFRYEMYDMRPCVECAVYIAEGQTCDTTFTKDQASVSRFVHAEYFTNHRQTVINMTYSTEQTHTAETGTVIGQYEVLHGNGYSALENYGRTIVFLDPYGRGVSCGEFGILSDVTSGSVNVNVESSEDVGNVETYQARWNRARNIVSPVVSTPESVNDATSPQSQAISYLANPSYPRDIPTNAAEYPSFIQHYLLLLFYFALNGPQWDSSHNFFGRLDGTDTPTPTLNTEPITTDECTWHVRTYKGEGNRFDDSGVFCDDAGDVYALVFPNSNLSGSLPTELGFLTNLQDLLLHDNAISGTLPSQLGGLALMKRLFLDGNVIEGTLPEFIGDGDWKYIQQLSLSTNLLSGTIPSNVRNLKSLTDLGLHDNMLVCDDEDFHYHGINGDFMDALGELTLLTQLYLEQNDFDCEIRNDLFKKLDRLTVLDLSDNTFRGLVPDHFFGNVLRVLDLHDNSLTGMPISFPVENDKLEFLALHNNLFGTNTPIIPPSISNLNKLYHLDLSNNGLTSTIPDTMGTMTKLSYLFLAQNPFDASQQVPPFLENLTELRELSLKSTRLSGTLPQNLRTLTNLWLLDLDNNNLTGSIPNQYQTLSNLKYLLLHRNQLTGSIPPVFGNPSSFPKLTLFLVGNNTLTGDLGFVCDGAGGANPNPVFLETDCGGDSPETVCTVPECCHCCQDDDPSKCQQYTYLANLDPLWQDGYQRKVEPFTFDGN